MEPWSMRKCWFSWTEMFWWTTGKKAGWPVCFPANQPVWPPQAAQLLGSPPGKQFGSRSWSSPGWMAAIWWGFCSPGICLPNSQAGKTEILVLKYHFFKTFSQGIIFVFFHEIGWNSLFMGGNWFFQPTLISWLSSELPGVGYFCTRKHTDWIQKGRAYIPVTGHSARNPCKFFLGDLGMCVPASYCWGKGWLWQITGLIFRPA